MPAEETAPAPPGGKADRSPRPRGQGRDLGAGHPRGCRQGRASRGPGPLKVTGGSRAGSVPPAPVSPCGTAYRRANTPGNFPPMSNSFSSVAGRPSPGSPGTTLPPLRDGAVPSPLQRRRVSFTAPLPGRPHLRTALTSFLPGTQPRPRLPLPGPTEVVIFGTGRD